MLLQFYRIKIVIINRSLLQFEVWKQSLDP